MKELKDRVFARLEREIEGFEPWPVGEPHPLGRRNVGLCATREVNVRTTCSESDSRFRCDLEPNWRSDFIVYACGSVELLYVLPSAALKRILTHARLNSEGRYSFAIRTDSHSLHPTNTGNEHDLEPFFDALHLLGDLPQDLVRPPTRVPAAVEDEPARGRTPAERIRYRHHRAVELDPQVQLRVRGWLEPICVSCDVGMEEAALEVHCTGQRPFGGRRALSIEDNFELRCPKCHDAEHPHLQAEPETP